MSPPAADLPGKWSGAWIDLAAFAAGLALAWFARWETTDLVWSLWLSSLCVGYALIVWSLSAALREFSVNAARDRTRGLRMAKTVTGALIGGGFLLGLAFFTVHFGGFHYVHSAFLQMFFPVEVNGQVSRDFPGLALYAEVFRRYAIFLPLAFLAEREAFRAKVATRADTAVTPAAIARRKANAMQAPMMAPYQNVIRMHLLIFFFAGAHFLRLESFAVYAVVYAVYFFPWRVLRKGGKAEAES